MIAGTNQLYRLKEEKEAVDSVRTERLTFTIWQLAVVKKIAVMARELRFNSFGYRKLISLTPDLERADEDETFIKRKFLEIRRSSYSKVA